MTAKKFRPLLARAVDPDESLPWPMLASPKLDGVRCLVIDGVPMSRTLKPLPNRALQSFLPWHQLDGLDGELVIGDPRTPGAYNRTTSAIMSHDGDLTDLKFWVFDDFSDLAEMYWLRLGGAEDRVEHIGGPLELLDCEQLADAEALRLYEDRHIEEGYEGVMLRSLTAQYKCGRTAGKGYELLKVKRFEDSEAEILRAHPLMRNGNAAEVSELGLTKRSTSAAGLVATDLLGSLDVRDVKTGIEFNLGGGPWFTEANRRDAWAARHALPGRIMKYKFQPAGAKEKPRFPGALGFRSPIDM